MAQPAPQTRSRRAAGAVGVAMLFSGAALLAHILWAVALPLALAFTASLLGLTVWLVWRRAPAAGRRALAVRVLIGLGVGLVGTVAYDLSRFLLAQLDPSPYNPFEAIRVFGLLLVGATAPPTTVMAAGFGFHVLNGAAFGIAYCFLFGRRGLLTGVAWGLFLELFQITLYPGWLDIRAYREFAMISAAGHLIYGAVLGFGCREMLRRVEDKPLALEQPPAR